VRGERGFDRADLRCERSQRRARASRRAAPRRRDRARRCPRASRLAFDRAQRGAIGELDGGNRRRLEQRDGATRVSRSSKRMSALAFAA
jgi:hypothetical protein